MLLTIASVLDEKDLSRLRDIASALTWRDGRVTAGRTAKAVKRNEQADLTSPAGRKFSGLVLGAIREHAVVKAAARPREFSNLLLSRTSNGGHYGAHVDNAIMRKGDGRFRTDLSYTLFLADPSDYEGGELILHHAGVDQAIKGAAGDLVLYPSSCVHQVAPVTSGERTAAVGWIESLIADESRRDLLFDLENLRVSLRQSLPAQSPELITLDKTIANLVRMWAQP